MESRGVDIVQPDPGTCGGLREVWAIGMMAEAHSMRIAPHNCGGPVLTAASVQMAACMTNLAILEMFPYRPEIHYDIVENPFEKQIVGGRLNVPTAPGLGVTLNHKTVDRFCVADIK
jgi:galactonate dehydratase